MLLLWFSQARILLLAYYNSQRTFFSGYRTFLIQRCISVDSSSNPFSPIFLFSSFFRYILYLVWPALLNTYLEMYSVPFWQFTSVRKQKWKSGTSIKLSVSLLINQYPSPHYPNGSFFLGLRKSVVLHTAQLPSPSLYLLCARPTQVSFSTCRPVSTTIQSQSTAPSTKKMPKTDRRAKYQRAQTDENKPGVRVCGPHPPTFQTPPSLYFPPCPST